MQKTFYFDGSTKLLSDLCLAIFLDFSAKPFFLCTTIFVSFTWSKRD